MQRKTLTRLWFALFIAFTTTLAAFGQGGFDIGQFQLPDELAEFSQSTPSAGIKVTSQVLMDGPDTGLLVVELTIADAWKIYSITQPAGGPTPTKIHLRPSDKYQLLGSFAPNSPPKVEFSKDFKMDVETFSNRVSWSVPIQVKSGANDGPIVEGYVEGLACEGQCIPFGEDETAFQASAANNTGGVSLAATRLNRTHSNVRMWLGSAHVAPGESTQLFVAFEPDTDWHVYAYSKETIQFQTPTLTHVDLPAGWKSGEANSAAQVLSKVILKGDPPIREYIGPATIAIPIKVPQDAKSGAYPITGKIAFQTCSTQCDPPAAFAFESLVQVGKTTNVPATVTIQTGGVSYNEVASAVTAAAANIQPDSATPTIVEPTDASTGGATTTLNNDVAGTSGDVDVSTIDFGEVPNQSSVGLGKACLLALLGGFILNFMPCVLPVIGLKVISFVDQAGSDRKRVLTLNSVYVLGILSIFWVLAGLSLAGIGWGQQFSNRTFTISLICLVFAMALSFLGIWEIPIPGFATTKGATNLTEKEGLSGAFFKGIITTLLATPCSAPMFGVAYGFAVQSGSAFTSFLIFTLAGLGMGLPYLLIGINPSLIRFLPKPGVWMETFKHLMGFVLLGTVVFLMQSLQFKDLIPVVGLLFGLWFACWWIGSIPFTASRGVRMRGWAISAIICLIALGACFSDKGLFGHSNQKFNRTIQQELAAATGGSGDTSLVSGTASAHGDHLPWEPFNESRLSKMLGNGETVMVDFTADYCTNCRFLESTVLNTKPIQRLVADNSIRSVVADLGTDDPAMIDLLTKLQGHNSIPFLAIFPAGQPENVVRFSGLYTSDTLIDALEKAGPSQTRIATRPTGTSSIAKPKKSLISKQLP